MDTTRGASGVGVLCVRCLRVEKEQSTKHKAHSTTEKDTPKNTQRDVRAERIHTCARSSRSRLSTVAEHNTYSSAGGSSASSDSASAAVAAAASLASFSFSAAAAASRFCWATMRPC